MDTPGAEQASLAVHKYPVRDLDYSESLWRVQVYSGALCFHSLDNRVRVSPPHTTNCLDSWYKMKSLSMVNKEFCHFFSLLIFHTHSYTMNIGPSFLVAVLYVINGLVSWTNTTNVRVDGDLSIPVSDGNIRYWVTLKFCSYDFSFCLIKTWEWAVQYLLPLFNHPSQLLTQQILAKCFSNSTGTRVRRPHIYLKDTVVYSLCYIHLLSTTYVFWSLERRGCW